MFKDRQFVFTTSWRVAKLYEKAMKKVHDEYKLTQCEMDVILFLKVNYPKNTSRDIAEYRSISKSLICKSVALLCQKDLIVAKGDMIDARIMRLELTEKGSVIADELVKATDDVCMEIFNGISNSEMLMLRNLFSRLSIKENKRNNMF